MNLAAVEQIAKAVLYEGYMLYPYRRSSVKNQQRWNFGVLYPSAYAEAQSGTDSSTSQTECIIAGATNPALELRVRFLQLVERTIAGFDAPLGELPEEQAFIPVNLFEVDGKIYQPWQEAVEREIVLPFVVGETLGHEASHHEFTFPAGRQLEPIRNKAGLIAGVIVRAQGQLQAGIAVEAQRHLQDVFRLSVRTSNLTPFLMEHDSSRERALRSSLLSAHVVMGANRGRFV
jgi:hypothetical protein